MENEKVDSSDVKEGEVNSALEQYFAEYENISVHETMLKVT